MYEIMHESTRDLLAIRVSGKLDKADYEQLHPWLHEMTFGGSPWSGIAPGRNG